MRLSCGRCRHRFDTEAGEGFAGVSLVYGEGWMDPRFKQRHLCPDCRDSLRAWMGLVPDGVDPRDVPSDHR